MCRSAESTTADTIGQAASFLTMRRFDFASRSFSCKTQRLYVRQAFQPVLKIPVAIRDPDLPIGTPVFTVLERPGNGGMQWSAVSLVGRHLDDDTLTDPPSAKAALDRTAIPQDTLDQIAGMVSPRSSLIISDEALSSETGRGTEFVVVMSGEPQGGIKQRRRSPEIEVRYQRPNQWTRYWRSPYASPYSTW